MENTNNELFQGKPSLPTLPMLGFASGWLFCRENFFVPAKQSPKSTVEILTIEL
jgi:hypothetical protein